MGAVSDEQMVLLEVDPFLNVIAVTATSLDYVFDAPVRATEEAITNALFAARVP